MDEQEKKRRLDRIALSDAAINRLNDHRRKKLNDLLHVMEVETKEYEMNKRDQRNERALYFLLGFGVAMMTAIAITLYSGKV